MRVCRLFILFFFFNDTATTEIYTLSLHDALPIWLHVDPRVRADSHKRRQCLGRDAVSRVAIHHAIEPSPHFVVTVIVAAKRVEENVDVGQDHRRRSRISRTALESSRLTPGRVPPFARETGSLTGARCERRPEAARTRRRPRSMSDVTVSPSRCAAALASR